MRKSIVLVMFIVIGLFFVSNLLANNDICYGQTFRYDIIPSPIPDNPNSPGRYQIIQVPVPLVGLVLEFQNPDTGQWFACGSTSSDENGFYTFALGAGGNVYNSDLLIALDWAAMNGERVKFRIKDIHWNKIRETFEWTFVESYALNIDILFNY